MEDKKMTGKDLIKMILDYGIDREMFSQRGTIEREIDPSEVIVDENGRIVIKDWKRA